MSLRVGHVDLDTSHPGSWIPIIRDLGHEVVGVYDGGTVYPEGYASEFAEENDIPQVFSSAEDMAQAVDLAIIHSCNWDLHLGRAKPFIEAGKAVLIDKPMVGNMADIQRLLDWEEEGHRIVGGSSLYFAEEITEFLNRGGEKRGKVNFAYAGCAVDRFNYGIHAYSLLCGLMGPGVESVRHLGTKDQHQIEVVWKDGRRGILAIGETSSYLPFYATIVTDRDVYNITVDSSNVYRAFLETVLPYLEGKAQKPVTLEDLLEVEKSALAARVSWQDADKRVFLNDLSMDDKGYDGTTFARQYRRSKRRNSN